MRMIGALAILLAAVAAGCGEPCGKIHQSLVLESPDDDLQGLLDTCAKGPSCTPSCTRPAACVPLCQRLLDLAGQFSGTESIESCFYEPPRSIAVTDAGHAAGGVDVTYRVSSCP